MESTISGFSRTFKLRIEPYGAWPLPAKTLYEARQQAQAKISNSQLLMNGDPDPWIEVTTKMIERASL